MHKKTKMNQKKANKRAAVWGECDLTLQDSPSRRNLSDVQTQCHVEIAKTLSSELEELTSERINCIVRTARITVRTYKSTVQTCRNTPSEHFTQKNLKKRGKEAEKYFPSNFQSTHVYNTDISIQLVFQKYPKI